uniref:Uncharacterized protein n=1 Tax=Rhinolophus ferrumequinum TaxID=59479 RepID=A0A671FRA8_RHIFE
MPFKSAKCRICYHQDAMLLPQSKISHFWSISTTSKYKKEIFLFSKRVLPNSFPIAAWLVGSPFPAGEEKTQTRERAHMLLTHMRRKIVCSLFHASTFSFFFFFSLTKP